MDVTEVIEMIRKAAKKAGGKSALAKQAGVSPQFLSDMLAGRREPGKKVLEFLGVERTYRRKPKA